MSGLAPAPPPIPALSFGSDARPAFPMTPQGKRTGCLLGTGCFPCLVPRKVLPVLGLRSLVAEWRAFAAPRPEGREGRAGIPRAQGCWLGKLSVAQAPPPDQGPFVDTADP